MSNKAYIVGVGMTPFRKPGDNDPYPRMAEAAVRQALADARIDYTQVQQAYVGFVYADSTAGQRSLYEVGMTGIPVINVNNNCSTGSTALFLARQAVEGGTAECVLALGFEQMKPGPLGSVWPDRPSPFDRFNDTTDELVGAPELPRVLRYFAGAGRDHMEKHGTRLSTFAKIRAKASRHAANNPLALLRTPMSEEEVLASPSVMEGVMTRLMACPPTCGAAAAIVCSESFARRHGLNLQVRIAAQALTTDRPETFTSGDMRQLVGAGMAREAAQKVYAQAGIGPEDLDLVELHDCFAQNELLAYESLGLCAEGESEAFVFDGQNTYGGKVVTNPSGGLLSKGHPLGATGLAQCFELTQQLRGNAQRRQVEGARLALQHNLGMGGACVVTLYERA
jgi:acetyl-CoA acetyltransferase